MRRVVVTGMGAVTPIGNNIEENFESIKNSKCGIKRITGFDTENSKVKVAGEITALDFEKYFSVKEQKRLDKFVAYALIAAGEAMESSGLLEAFYDHSRAGVIIGTGIGGLRYIEQEHEKMLEKGAKYISPFFVPGGISNIAAANISMKYDLRGSSSCIITACAAGTNAIGEAYRQIKDGYSDVMLCGGTESCISEFGVGGFNAIKALSHSEDPESASIPFDKRRDGFVMGEGAGVMVIEEYDHAVKRGANILCEIVGYGSNCDAFHVTAPREDGSMARECMRMAIEDAGISVSDIDYINAHGTSTHLNDKCETLAIKDLFGDHADKVYVSSTKSMTGHMLGASGAVEAIYTAFAVMNDFCPPNIGYKEKDEECDLNIVANKGVSTKVTYAMSNSFGFGGHNASIIIKK